ncbi:hypothetical protein BU25DRAFT_454996 [Macroventuria anomochaeta]|uniref:Uncharacterized protein n=1 Tax=Macroventuria anomochaeta TaxID=301207 RepID=A0ACB6SBN9_9PLEO|nr:uncharacterized protein BU25DRAFT_454996 [Macroventuria anomochaeta]KAF2631556.1 hypothetical protein BU25DRAFT_454996 [Macroventuria anomochaeta]
MSDLVYVLTAATEHSGVKLDYINAPVPVGCAQRVNRLKESLKNDVDALKNSIPVSDTKVRRVGRMRR